MSRRSLRRRIVLTTLGAVLLVWLLAAALTATLYHHLLNRSMDQSLIAAATHLQSMVRFTPPGQVGQGRGNRNRQPWQPGGRGHGGPPPLPPGPLSWLMPAPPPAGEPANPLPSAQDNPDEAPLIFDPEHVMTGPAIEVNRSGPATAFHQPDDFFIRHWPLGSVVASSGTLLQSMPPDAAGDGKRRFNDIRDNTGRRVRVFHGRFVINSDTPPPYAVEQAPVWIAVAVPLDRRDAEHALMLALILTTGFIGAGAVILAVLWSVHHGLAPVADLSNRLQDIGQENLSQRVAVEDAPVELQGFVAQINQLLDRLQTAFERERTFIADAAHELRTPLAALRVSAELALRQPRSAEHYQQILRDDGRVLQGMQNLVEKLLLLARLDHQAQPLQVQPVELHAIVETTWDEAMVALDRYDIHWENQLETDVVWQVDPDLACLVIHNLLRNGCQYVNMGGTVRVIQRLHSDRQCLRVSNTGCQLSQAEMDEMFNRFWQADQGRSRTGQNAGLGLSIALRATQLMGGTIRAQRGGGDWIEIELCVPRPRL